MSAPNLTRAQAVDRRAVLVGDVAYRITLDLTDGAGGPGTETFTSHTTVRFAARPGTETFIELVADRIDSAVLNGTELDVSGYRPADGIALPGLAADNELTITARCAYSRDGQGLHRFVDPADDEVYLYSQFETADAKRVFACFDQPDVKAVCDVSITAPAHWQVVSNAEIARTAPAAGGAVTRVFAPTRPISTYLVAVIAGPYAVWRDEYRDDLATIPLGLYCRASLAPHLDPERLLTETKQGFGFYHRLFGIGYPFGKYDQLFVPEFNAGAMEHPGAVTFLEDYVFRSKVTGYLYERRAETLLHEMAHMWFGDLVTMHWWDDLWLNESFATFAAALAQAEATEYTGAWTTFANVEKSWAYRQDQLPTTHPIAADMVDIAAVEVNFDGITYAKGASVLKQLAAYVGREAFFAGLRDYFDRHGWGNAGFDDLVGALERASGRDLSDWGAQWLKTTGITTVAADFDVDDEGRFTRFALRQSPASPGGGAPRRHRLAVGVYDDDGSGRLVRTARVECDVDGEVTEVPELIGRARGTLVLPNDDDLTYCLVDLDADSLAAAVAGIDRIVDPLPRTLCWSAAWQMTRDARMPAREMLALVHRGAAAETEISVLQRLLLQAHTALESYADPAWVATTGRAEHAAFLLAAARSAPAGSDHQLAFVSAWARSALPAEQRAVARILLGDEPGEAGLPGLAVDTDLRWQLVQALAAAGAIGPERIDTEQRRDPTAAGARAAAQADAARPDPDAKEQAWQAVVGDDAVPNVTARAIIAGFTAPGAAGPDPAYTERYFAALDRVWARPSSESAQTVVTGLYPRWDVSETAIAAADRFLAGDRPAALARLVAEGRAETQRALAARRRDRGA